MTKNINIIFLSILLMMSFACVDEKVENHIQPGERIPQFSIITTDDRALSNKSLLGRPSLIIHFTTICPDCQRQLPEIQAVYDNLGDDAGFLAINRGEDIRTVQKHMEKNGYTIPTVAEGDRYLYNLFDRGSMSGVPQIYISDKDGIVRHYHDDTRTIPAAEIIKEIKSLSVK